MVTHIVLQTGAAFLLIIGAVKAADFWVEKRTKERIKTKTVEIWYQFASSDPLVVVKAPLRLISKGLDSIYGLKVVSWRSFWRSSVVSTCLLMASLAITGMIVGTPFALESPPWKMFDQTFETVDEVMKNPAYWKDKKPEEISSGKRFFAALSSFKTVRSRLAYSAGVVVGVAVLTVPLNFTCGAIVRWVVRDMILATTFTNFFALLMLNVMMSAAAYIGFLFVVCIGAIPLTWPLLLLVIVLTTAVSWWVGLSCFVPGLALMFLFSPAWIRVVTWNAVLPSLLVVLLSVISLLLFPLRRPVHWVGGSVT